MARKFARILLTMLVAAALGGIAACGDSGPAEQAEQAAEQMGEAAQEMGEAAQEMGEAAKEMVEEETEQNQ
jgi:predicted small lipoprotein YifL